MSKANGRLMVSVPEDVKNEIDILKQKEYYDKPYSELYRKIIRLGLDKMQEGGGQDDGTISGI